MLLLKTHFCYTPGYTHTSAAAAAYSTAAVAAAAYSTAVAGVPAAEAGCFYKSHKQTDPPSSSPPYYLQHSARRG